MTPPTSPRAAGGLYVRVLVAIGVGALLGQLAPEWAVALKPLGDAFIRLIKMLIAPLVFCTLVVGMAGMGDLRKVGRVGAKTLLYFEAVTTFALALGLLVVNVAQPGAGMNVDASHLDTTELSGLVAHAEKRSTVQFLMGIIPEHVVDAFARGDMLQVLLFSVLFGMAAAHTGEAGRTLVQGLDALGHVLFRMVAMVMKLAPLGAMGAMAYTVGKYGVGSLLSLGKLMAAFYLTAVVFVVVVLGTILRTARVSIFRFILFIREEILVVLGTSSSESALPMMMERMEKLGCPKPVVGLVIPTGYSFNLDGTSIYLTMAAIFVAQATNTPMSLGDQLALLGVLLLTSKGAAAVTGGGFITLAATLASTGSIPVAGLTLLLGIDRFMSEARAITNLIGNGVATVMVSHWEGSLDREKLDAALSSPALPRAPT